MFVEKDSRAGVAIFLTFPPRKYSDKKEKTWELFQKISHVFREISYVFWKSSDIFCVIFGDVLEGVCWFFCAFGGVWVVEAWRNVIKQLYGSVFQTITKKSVKVVKAKSYVSLLRAREDGNLAWFCCRVRSINSAVWGDFFTALKNASHGFNILQIGQHVFCWGRCSCCDKEKWRRDRATLFGADKSTIFSVFHEGIVGSEIIVEQWCLYMLLFRVLFFLSFYVD